jgi:Tfp pilus assembly protein PilV
VTRRRRAAGFSYLETVAATALLGVALVGSAGLLLRWHALSERIEQRARAEQALATEMAEVLATPPQLLARGESGWGSAAAAASGLEGALGTRTVARFGDAGLLRVRVTLRWGDGREAARETLVGGRP